MAVLGRAGATWVALRCAVTPQRRRALKEGRYIGNKEAAAELANV